MFESIKKEIDKGFFIPWPLLKNFLGTVGPLIAILTRHPDSIIKNISAYGKRFNNHRVPWAHIDNETRYDSTIELKQKYIDNPGSIDNELCNVKYLRPTRFCESDAVEIRALAHELRAEAESDIKFAQAAFNWVKDKKYLVFKPISGALQTFKTKGGVCLDQLSLLVAIARAGGIPARYRLYGLAPTQELYDAMVAPNPIIKETYETLGFIDAMHGEAELKVNGTWINGDPTFSDELSVGMGIPISELGGEPGWRVRVPKSVDIRFEGFPILFRHFFIPLLIILRKTVDGINDSLDDIRENGRIILDKISIEEYNINTKKTFKPTVPPISEVKAFREQQIKKE
jgi:hypothetical protein